VNPGAISVAEEMRGIPGVAADTRQGGCGFDLRRAMGIPNCLFDIVRSHRDENWPLDRLWHELTNRREDERTISYVECQDQAIVGAKTMIFELIDADMHHSMRVEDANVKVDRGIALHKMLRLATIATAGAGYLNFMDNEFG
jgi:1,4-alpha-glucan branching enzyme